MTHIDRLKALTVGQFYRAAQAGNLAIDAVLQDIKDLVADYERTPSPHKGEPMAWAPPAHCSRCIDCDGTGLYPSGARCKSCLGTGLVDADDGEPLFASPPPVAEGMVLVPREALQDAGRAILSLPFGSHPVSGPEWDAVDAAFQVLQAVLSTSPTPNAATPNQADGAGE